MKKVIHRKNEAIHRKEFFVTGIGYFLCNIEDAMGFSEMTSKRI
jgi:hypothetical protein